METRTYTVEYSTLLFAYFKLTNQIARIAVRILPYGLSHADGQIVG